VIERRRPGLRVGAFVAGALLLALVAFFALTGNRWFERQQLAVIQFRGGVAGLYVGAPVTFRGVPVGQVESIGIEVDARTLDARIPVRVRLQPDSVTFSATAAGAQRPTLDVLVERGLRARLVAQSFVTGQKLIDLDFVPSASSPAAPSAAAARGNPTEIPVVADKFDALFDQLASLPMRETVDDLRVTMQRLQATLDDVRATMATARGALDRSAGEFAGVAQQGRRALAETSAALAALRTSVQQSLASVQTLIDRGNAAIDRASPELQATLASARSAAQAAEQAMQRVNELTDARAPLRSDLDAAVRDLSQAARALREWGELLEERPNAVIFGRSERARSDNR
jgi:paraquat-inducible protein B